MRPQSPTPEPAYPGTPRLVWVWFAALVSALISLWARPLLPVDETRYLAVAWEMWRTGDFLVPHINGETYSHKPPLLFWMMHAGWSVFGVNTWWPRLIPFLLLTANALMLRRLGRQLWPQEAAGRSAGTTAAAVFLGSLYAFLFGTVVMFDLLLLLAVLGGWSALLKAHREGSWKGNVLWFGLAIGLGVLAKGPVVLLFTLLPALAAGHWSGRTTGNTAAVGWTAFLGTLLGAAIALCWAIPAGIHGGEEYRDAIFWGQTAGRVSDSFAHARPWHWYLPILPAMLMPWPLYPATWKQWRRSKEQPRGPRSDARRFLVWSTVPAFLFLCLMSGKQPHYLLPTIAGLSLALGGHFSLRLRAEFGHGSRWNHAGPVLVLLLFAGFFVLLPQISEGRDEMTWLLEDWSPWPALALAAAALLWWWMAARASWRSTLACLFAPLLLATLNMYLHTPLNTAYDTTPLGLRAKALQEAGHPVAFFGAKFHGQFTFTGRLIEPVSNPEDFQEAYQWAQDNPEGTMFVLINDYAPDSYTKQAQEVFLYASHRMAVWSGKRFARAHQPVKELPVNDE